MIVKVFDLREAAHDSASTDRSLTSGTKAVKELRFALGCYYLELHLGKLCGEPGTTTRDKYR